MTTPSRHATAPPEFRGLLEAEFPPEELQAELIRRQRLDGFGAASRNLRALEALDRAQDVSSWDFAELAAVVTHHTASKEVQAYLFSNPDWLAICEITRQTEPVLAALKARNTTSTQTTNQDVSIAVLASSLIARHAARASAYLHQWGQYETTAGQALNQILTTAERLSAQVAGLNPGDGPATPRNLQRHARLLTRQLRVTGLEVPTSPPGQPRDEDEPALTSALRIAATGDAVFAEAAHLMTALSHLGSAATRSAQRLNRDVRLHGMIETVQIRGFEAISAIARAAMRRYDRSGQEYTGRRAIAAVVHHFAEQRLERLRGSLGESERRDVGFYDNRPPDRVLASLYDETRMLWAALSSGGMTLDQQTDHQIRFLLLQRRIGEHLGSEYPLVAQFPPLPVVASMPTDTPAITRLQLIEALRARVEANPYHPDASFLNRAADMYAHEIAGPADPTDDARGAVVAASDVAAVASYIVEHRVAASALILADAPGLSLDYGQAERALDVLQKLRVVDAPQPLRPRDVLATEESLPELLEHLEQRLPSLLALPRHRPSVPAQEAPSPAAPGPKEAGPPAAVENGAEPSPAPLPRRDRTKERRHPGSDSRLDAEPVRAVLSQQDRERIQGFVEARQAREAAFPAPDKAPAHDRPTTRHATPEQHPQQQAQEAASQSMR